jgi:hypothetical protein
MGVFKFQRKLESSFTPLGSLTDLDACQGFAAEPTKNGFSRALMETRWRATWERLGLFPLEEGIRPVKVLRAGCFFSHDFFDEPEFAAAKGLKRGGNVENDSWIRMPC